MASKVASDVSSKYVTNDIELNRNMTKQNNNSQHRHKNVTSSKKLSLLLHRTLTYSYRQRCCSCIPYILCEILFPLLMIIILALTRWGTNGALNSASETGLVGGGSGNNSNQMTSLNQFVECPQSESKSVLSTKLLSTCFEFPENFLTQNDSSSSTTSFIFQPKNDEIDELVKLGKEYLEKISCINNTIESKMVNTADDDDLLQNRRANTIIIDFSPSLSSSALKTIRTIYYTIYVRMPPKYQQTPNVIDYSFLSFEHPTLIEDRSNKTYKTLNGGKNFTEFPQFSNIKLFIDTLLISYQTGKKNLTIELERNVMKCTKYRKDVLYTSKTTAFTIIILVFIDIVFLIPFIILLNSMIKEKNNKVKEILKVINIEPILNNIAWAVRYD
ncbi:unnamed protein product [Didymodactylos carnosus]|uniref:Uncharacterized protein n=1 Tax=Didymodactylos carnosus TaxID=1234261 RepID=A0A816D3N6_9BILA|nr:unnamed protein product [Didymodactylos carnosus]CAF1631267.1 unnamed protein product [Didymodactylos carnosus]CAF4168983.1 unnamed protein product [Didymodactylos carnosus]CAF4530533.1 unnamed protein product [Didymodactylos carnosus]